MKLILPEGLHIVGFAAADANDHEVIKFILEVYPMPAELGPELYAYLLQATQSFFNARGVEFDTPIDISPSKGPVQ